MDMMSLPHAVALSHTLMKERVCFNNTWGLCEWNEGFRRLSVTIKRVRLWFRDKKTKDDRGRLTIGRGEERDTHTDRQAASAFSRAVCLPVALHYTVMDCGKWWHMTTSTVVFRAREWDGGPAGRCDSPIHFFSLSLFLHSGLLAFPPPSPSFLPCLFLFSLFLSPWFLPHQGGTSRYVSQKHIANKLLTQSALNL